jgi:hypothetical protein
MLETQLGIKPTVFWMLEAQLGIKPTIFWMLEARLLIKPTIFYTLGEHANHYNAQVAGPRGAC